MKTACYFQYTTLFADPQIVWREMAVESSTRRSAA
jgi:hypothetical protein